MDRQREHSSLRSRSTGGAAGSSPSTCQPSTKGRPCRSATPGNLELQHGYELGDSSDASEREADHLARRLLHSSAGARPLAIAPAPASGKVARKALEGPSGQRVALSAQALAAGTGAGRVLDTPTRSFFEPRLGRDLSAVRVHTGSAAEQLAAGLQARAFTLGSDIVFGRGEYQPESPAGRELLAHELVHVAQGDGSTIRREPLPGASKRPDAATADQPTELHLQGTLDQRIVGFKELVRTTAVHRLIANQQNLGLWSLMVERAIPSADLAALGMSQIGASRPYFELQDIEDPGLRELRAEQALGKYRACTGCHIERDLWGSRTQRERESLTAWASPNQIRAQPLGGANESHAPQTFGSFRDFDFAKPMPSGYRPPAGSAEGKLHRLFPDPEQTRAALRRVEPIMQALGPEGYKVLPPGSMLATMISGRPEDLRAAIIAAIVQRKADYGELIEKIRNGDVGWEHFAPIIRSLLPSADNEVRAAIQKEMDDKALWDKVEAAVVGALTAAALILTIFPPSTLLGLAALASLEISLGIYGVQKGDEMMRIGAAYGLATGADDVFTRGQQESGGAMVFMGFVSMAGGWLQVFGGAARAASLAPKLAPVGSTASLATTGSSAVAKVIQRGEFVITVGADGSWFVTVASRPDIVIMVRGNVATMYHVLPSGGMRAVQSATLAGDVATPVTAPLMLSASGEGTAASTALVPRASAELVPFGTVPAVGPTGAGAGPRVLITPPPREPRLLGTGAPTTYTWDQISAMRQPMLWQEREIYLQQLYGSAGQQHFPVPGTGGRFTDVPVQLPSGQLFAGEAKSYRYGWITIRGEAQMNAVPLSAKIEQQIAKDVYLRNNVPGYDPRWMFTDAPPTEALRQALRDANIMFIEYLR